MIVATFMLKTKKKLKAIKFGNKHFHKKKLLEIFSKLTINY